MLKRSHVVDWLGDFEPAKKTAAAPAAVEAEPVSPADGSLTASEREERQQILEVLDRCAGNQTAAAQKLNMARSTLVLKLKRYGIRRPQADREA